MESLSQYTLDKIIDIPSLQNIQDKFSKMTCLSSITVDKFGTPVTAPSNFSKFCNVLRDSKIGCSRCINCDAEGGLRSMLSKKPIIYTCHAGLTDLSAPIIVNNTYFGCILCGQVMIKEAKNKDSINLKELSEVTSIPIKKLENALNEVKVVEYDALIDAADFLSLFANLITEMGVATITHFHLLKETEEKMKYQELAKDAQFKALQSKVNPHFLFNTLNTIAGMALMENSQNTAELIYALSDLLRYGIKNSEDMVEIGSELESIRKYLFIESVRYSDKLSYDIQISDEILKYKVPVMTLQPIIENAIIHGLEPKKDPGKITISGKILSNKDVLIKISDDGIGMSSEKLNMLIQNINSSSSSNCIGMKIVQDRLIYYFGSKCEIKIESTLGTGTTVYITVPLID